MDKKKLLFFAVALLILIAVGVGTKVFFLDNQQNSISALRVDSVPPADLYLNGEKVGKTPFENDKLVPGEYRIKLVATGVTGTFYPWETKVKLTSDSLTYLSRDIGKSEETSGHQILWLEKLPSGESAQLAVISEPDGAKITVDAEERGIASTIFKDIPPGNHDIIISQERFGSQIIKGNLRLGFRLNAAVKLARTEEGDLSRVASPSATLNTASASGQITSNSGKIVDTFPKPYVLIKETGVGFLRVRAQPSTTATESARVKPGEKYPLELEGTSWTKIKVASISGWVNDQYIQKFK